MKYFFRRKKIILPDALLTILCDSCQIKNIYLISERIDEARALNFQADLLGQMCNLKPTASFPAVCGHKVKPKRMIQRVKAKSYH